MTDKQKREVELDEIFREHKRQYQREYRAKNLDKCREAARKWVRNNAERNRENVKKWRERKNNVHAN